MKEGNLFCFVIMISPKPWCFRLCYGIYHQKKFNELGFMDLVFFLKFYFEMKI
jgi:hypothetical protein